MRREEREGMNGRRGGDGIEEGKERGEKGEYQNVYHIGDGEGGCNSYNGMISVQKFKRPQITAVSAAMYGTPENRVGKMWLMRSYKTTAEAKKVQAEMLYEPQYHQNRLAEWPGTKLTHKRN